MKVLKEAASYLVCTYNYSGTLKGRKVIHIKKNLKKKEVKQNQVKKKLKPLYRSLIMPYILFPASP